MAIGAVIFLNSIFPIAYTSLSSSNKVKNAYYLFMALDKNLNFTGVYGFITPTAMGVLSIGRDRIG